MEPVLQLCEADVEAIRAFLAARRSARLAVLFSDLRPFAAAEPPATRSADYRESLVAKLRREHLRVLRDVVEAEATGRLLVEFEDSLLALFTDPAQAVACGLRSLREFERLNRGRPETEALVVRLGIDAADVAGRSDLDPVACGRLLYRAGEITAAAEPGGLAVSAAVYDEIGEPLPARALHPAQWRDAGSQPIAGLSDPIRVWQAAASLPRPVEAPPRARRPLRPPRPGRERPAASRPSVGPKPPSLETLWERLRQLGRRPPRTGGALVIAGVAAAAAVSTLLLRGSPGDRARRAAPAPLTVQPVLAPPAAPLARRPRADAEASIPVSADRLDEVLELAAAHPERFNRRGRRPHLLLASSATPTGAAFRFRVEASPGRELYQRVFHVDAAGNAALLRAVPSLARPGREERVDWDALPQAGRERLILLASAGPVEGPKGLLGDDDYFPALANVMRATLARRRPRRAPRYALAVITLTCDAAGRTTLAFPGDRTAARLVSRRAPLR
jgi:hypothetical protein